MQGACRTKQLSEPQSWCQLPRSTDHCQYMANTRLAGHWTHDTAFLLLDQTGSWRMFRGEARASSILTRLSIFSPRPRVLVLMTLSRISGAKWGETCHHGHQMSPDTPPTDKRHTTWRCRYSVFQCLFLCVTFLLLSVDHFQLHSNPVTFCVNILILSNCGLSKLSQAGNN